MDVEVVKALKNMNDTINDLVRRVDNMSYAHYQENAEQITDIEEIVVDGLYEDTLEEFDVDPEE